MTPTHSFMERCRPQGKSTVGCKVKVMRALHGRHSRVPSAVVNLL